MRKFTEAFLKSILALMLFSILSSKSVVPSFADAYDSEKVLRGDAGLSSEDFVYETITDSDTGQITSLVLYSLKDTVSK